MRRTTRICAVIAAALIAVAGVTYGPELWNAYRFMDTLDRKAAAYEVDGGPWPQLQDSCALCHGAQGRAGNAQYPSLAGLSAAYIETQLRAFADGTRHDPQMSPFSASLNDAQIKQLAAYYARQTPVRNPDAAADPDMTEQGRMIVAANGCAACHGERLTGSPLGPLLAGQGEVYLVNQLMAYQQRRRQDSAMNGIASVMSEEDIRAAAHYLAAIDPDTD